MATPPKRKTPSRLPTPDTTIDEGQDNLVKPADRDTIKFLNFKVPASFKQRFDATALAHGMKNVDLLKAMFEEWCERHGEGYTNVRKRGDQ